MERRLALITGAPGWLGNRFLNALAGTLPELAAISNVPSLEPRVRCLVLPRFERDPVFSEISEVEVVVGDLAEPESLVPFFQGAEGATVFHMAGLIHPQRRTKELYRINVTGTANLIEAAERVGVRRIVAVSSNSTIGVNYHPLHLFDEESTPRPYLHYGKSKLVMETLLRQAHSRGKLETVIIRPCWFYGPGQPPRQTLFFKMIREGKAPILGDGEIRRSVSYVDSVCQSLLLAEVNEDAAGQTFWVADEQPYTMNEIVNTVERLLRDEFNFQVTGKRLKLPAITGDIAEATDRFLQFFGLYHQKIHVLGEMNKTIACDITKAKKKLGYRPLVELEEGMRRSISWCLERGHKM